MSSAENAVRDREERVGTHFRVFADGHGRWCAGKDDGTVDGIFSSRETAIRFARRESFFDNLDETGLSAPGGTP